MSLNRRPDSGFESLSFAQDNLETRLTRGKVIDVLRLFGGQREGRLVRHYFLALVIFISGGLIASGFLEVYFGYQESWEHFSLIQQQIAASTAFKVEQYIQEIQRSMKTATKTREIVRDGITAEFRWDLRRLLVTTPAMTEAVAFDLSGVKRADASRMRSAPLFNANAASPEALANARQNRSYFGPVHFTSATGPYMMVAVPIEQFAEEVIGLVQGTIDLKYVGELISEIRVGKAGSAYLVTDSGQLIAHSDLSLVLQNHDVREMSHVKAAFHGAQVPVPPSKFVSHNVQGDKVFTSYVVVPGLGWAVFAEQPIQEIYAPLYASMLRTSAVLFAGLCVALFATFVVRRRVVGPLETLRAGVSRIGRGDLTARLNLKTGDEIEILADEFDAMATNLNNAYSQLEDKVAERTAQLSTANVKLEEASRHKSQFLANANHELRTPVSAIIGYGRIILRETQGQITELQRENVQDLLNNAERLLDMIDTLLDLAKIEAGKVDCRIEAVDISELVQSVTSAIEPFLSSGKVRLRRDVSPDIPLIRTDREKLRQILLNLLSNAVKFTERGEIKISAISSANRLEVTVADTGIGVKKDDYQQIFDEFYRGDTVRSREYHGTGLGLAIVKKLVAVLGGQIDVESELGKGSTFTLAIPLDYTAEPSPRMTAVT